MQVDVKTKQPQNTMILRTEINKMNNSYKYNGSYIISKDGSITSLKKIHFGKLMKQREDKDGYLLVNLCVSGLKVTEKVHRLIAQKYIPNPNKLPEVNHKNAIKTDNRVENLEWCNNQWNIDHSMRLGLRKGSIKVAQINKEGKLVDTHKSLSDASKKTGISLTVLSIALRSRFPNRVINGFRWKKIIS